MLESSEPPLPSEADPTLWFDADRCVDVVPKDGVDAVEIAREAADRLELLPTADSEMVTVGEPTPIVRVSVLAGPADLTPRAAVVARMQNLRSSGWSRVMAREGEEYVFAEWQPADGPERGLVRLQRYAGKGLGRWPGRTP